METVHLVALEAKHAGIDARLETEKQRPAPDAATLATLKKQKLRLKDEMTRR